MNLFTNISQIELIKPKKEKKIKKLVYIYKRINNKESYKFDVEYINKMEG